MASGAASLAAAGRTRPGTGDGSAGGKGVGISTAAQRLGSGAERAAADHLIARGYRIVAQNQRIGRGEIDIIALRAATLAFVEVKARRSLAYGRPEDAITPSKRRQMGRLAELWLASRPWAMAGILEVRFDIIAVDMSVIPTEIRHLPAAFTLTG